MRHSQRSPRVLGAGVPALVVAGLLVATLAGSGSTASAVGSSKSPATRLVARRAPAPTSPVISRPVATTSSTAPAITVPPAPAPTSATGNARLDALLPTLPPVLLDGGAVVHFGYNPVDCCHAGGYNPEPNEVWVSERALGSPSRLVYVTVHELGHSLHLHSARAVALTAAVAGAPVVRAGSQWDDSEKVADCVAWVLYPAETAASGITYWTCPDPWRSQVRAALD